MNNENMVDSDELFQDFDPNGIAHPGRLFGLPFSPENARLVIIPVPFEATVSYRGGTAKGPGAVLQASAQVDLLDGDIQEAWKLGVAMLPLPRHLSVDGEKARKKVQAYIRWLEDGMPEGPGKEMKDIPGQVDRSSSNMNDWVYHTAREWMQKGKMVAVLGGDHSTPLGLVNALAENHQDFGILQIDAHMDLRKAYEGFTYSHASIMYNALENKNISKLVQVGIRDYCQEEEAFASRSAGRVVPFYDRKLKELQYSGKPWTALCESIVRALPEHVYISFDIDGFDPNLCPHTGTPVPGGLQFDEAMYLVKSVVKAGKKIIGFDLCEVSPGKDEWDGNVGARTLFRLSNLMGVSQRELSFR